MSWEFHDRKTGPVLRVYRPAVIPHRSVFIDSFMTEKIPLHLHHTRLAFLSRGGPLIVRAESAGMVKIKWLRRTQAAAIKFLSWENRRRFLIRIQIERITWFDPRITTSRIQTPQADLTAVSATRLLIATALSRERKSKLHARHNLSILIQVIKSPKPTINACAFVKKTRKWTDMTIMPWTRGVLACGIERARVLWCIGRNFIVKV